jgi:SAM-dependent methyltransferase
MKEWYTRIFNADYLRTYGPLDDIAASQAQEVAECLGLAAGARILDLAGGYGRVAIPLARQGYRLTVQDLSADFLRIGRDRAAQAGTEIEWLQADMRDVPRTAAYDAVINLFSSFGYFEKDEDNEAVLHAVCGALKPGGLFLLDTINREVVARSDPFFHWVEGIDAITLDQTNFDLVAGRCRTQRIFHDLRTGERKDYSFDLRLFTAVELGHMLRRAGFVESTFYGGLNRTPLTSDARRLVVLARK